MSDTPGKSPIVTEDTMIKTNLRTISLVIAGVVAGTIFFVAVMTQLKSMERKQDEQTELQKVQYTELLKKIDESENRSIGKINWLYRLLNFQNPWDNSNATIIKPTNPNNANP